MAHKTKEVTWRHLVKGQILHGWKYGNSTTMARATVVSVNVANVSVMVFDTRPQDIPSEGTMFEVEMTEEEFRKVHLNGAVGVVRALRNNLAEYEIGYHEMYNGWISYDPWEMAANLKEKKMKLVGICRSIIPKTGLFDGEKYDIGLCAEYLEDGTRFWCHTSSNIINSILKRHGDLFPIEQAPPSKKNAPKCQLCMYKQVWRTANLTANNRHLKGPRKSCCCSHPDTEEVIKRKFPKLCSAPGFICFTEPGSSKLQIKTCPRWCPLKEVNQLKETEV